MEGAIFYATQYGSTAQYANWISEATGLPLFNTKNEHANPADYDFLVLGAPVLYYKLIINSWVQSNWGIIKDKPVIFFSVSGVGACEKLDQWIEKNFPEALISRMKHVALRGRQNTKKMTWYDRTLLVIGGLKNPDPQARQKELKSFDYMDQSSIAPIVELVDEFQAVSHSTAP